MAYITNTVTSVSEAAAAVFTPDIMVDHITNDTIFACVTQDLGSTTITTATSGWTDIGTQAASGGSRQAWFRKVCASGSETIPTFSGANDDWTVHFYGVRDADTTTPVHDQARADWNNISNPSTPALTTTEDNCLILYSFGSDGTAEMITPPSSMVPLEKAVGTGQTSISGFRNQYVAGAVPVITALHEVATEGGNAWTIAVKNASGGSMGPETTAAMDVIRYYGNGTWNGNFAALSSVAATINGITCSATLPTIATTSSVGDSPWGTATRFTTSSSTTAAFEGAVDTLASAVDLTDTPVSFMLTPETSVATARYGPFGIGIIFVDGSGNWITYQLSTAALLRLRTYFLTLTPGQGTIYDQSASPIDLTDITKIGWFSERTASTNTAALYNVKYLMNQTGAILVGGSAESPANNNVLYNSLATGWNLANYAQQQGEGQFLRKQSLQIGDGTSPTYAKFLGVSVELARTRNAIASKEQNAMFIPKEYAVDLTIRASAADTIDFSSSIFAVSSLQDFLIHASSSPSATYNFGGCSILGYRITNSVAGIVFNGAVFSGTNGITLNGGGMNGCSVLNSAVSTAVTTNDPENISDTAFTSAGTGHAIEITATGSYAFEGNTFTGYGANATTNAAIYNNSGGAVELVIPAGDPTPTIRNGAGATTTITQPPVAITATILTNSRVQLYNVTTDAEIYNDFETVTAFEYVPLSGVTAGDTIRIRICKKGYLPTEERGVFNAAGLAFLITQELDPVYTAYGLDGETITKFAADYIDTEIDLIVSTNFLATEVYAWYNYILTLEDGIRFFYGAIDAIDAGNLQIDTDIVDLLFDNTTTDNVFQNDNIRIFRKDEAYPVVDPTSGGGGIDVNWRNQVYTIVSGSGVTPSDITAIADAVWDEELSGHTTTGTTGKKLSDTATSSSGGISVGEFLALK